MSEKLWVDHISFSQLTAAQECPYGYYLQKIAGMEPVPNAFAQAGVLAHEILASWARGDLKPEEMPKQWVERYNETVTAEFPLFLESKGYRAKLFASILTFFTEFDGFPGYEIVGAEKEFKSSIGGEPFVGIIDLILRNKETGGLMIVDHKSCSLSSFRKNKEEMYRQLLLYSKYCADTFGEFPQTLSFNLIKENTYDERLFDCESYMAARIWAETVITAMKNRDIPDWMEVRPEMFRCTQLCNCRNHCKFGMAENHKRKDEILGKERVTALA